MIIYIPYVEDNYGKHLISVPDLSLAVPYFEATENEEDAWCIIENRKVGPILERRRIESGNPLYYGVDTKYISDRYIVGKEKRSENGKMITILYVSIKMLSKAYL